jgi:hypothetical protein
MSVVNNRGNKLFSPRGDPRGLLREIVPTWTVVADASIGSRYKELKAKDITWLMPT